MVVRPKLVAAAQDGGREVDRVRGLGTVASPKLGGQIKGIGLDCKPLDALA